MASLREDEMEEKNKRGMGRRGGGEVGKNEPHLPLGARDPSGLGGGESGSIPSSRSQKSRRVSGNEL